MPPTVSDYYRWAIEKLKEEVEATPDADVIGRDYDEWREYLERKWGMEPIEFDDSRGERPVEVERKRPLRGYDLYTNRMPSSVVKTNDVRLEIPVVPSETLQTIAQQEIATNPYSPTSGYPPFDYDHANGIVSVVINQTEDAIKRERDNIQTTIRRYNDNIAEQNRGFVGEVARAIAAKKDRVSIKNKGLDELAAKVGIPLTKKADVSLVVPTAPRVRSKIAPVMPPPRKRQQAPVLDAKSFNAIFELLDNQCRQFERTPQVFSHLREEGLRDVMLSSLNAVFEGAAGGETFRGSGKVDIHLQISQGEVFVSEIKFLAGPASAQEVVGQLRGRLTWKDSYGVAVILSKNAGFSDVLASVPQTVLRLPGYVPNTLRKVDERHFVARFTIPSDESRTAEVHIVVYNVYAPDAGHRAVKQGKNSD